MITVTLWDEFKPQQPPPATTCPHCGHRNGGAFTVCPICKREVA